MPWTHKPKTIDRTIDTIVASEAAADAQTKDGLSVAPSGSPLSFNDCKELYDAVRDWEHTAVGDEGVCVSQYRGAAPLGDVAVSVIVSRVDGPLLRSKSPIYSVSITRDTAVCAHYRTGKGVISQTQEIELSGMYAHARIDYAKRDSHSADPSTCLVKS